ncbi:hypothetical protein V5799_020478 [Amblyomma americanum]|uniref:Uncharacterized protein n=1 Tax=Amblyomma americanum TaxID=6943 RepID=A0AAQ4ETW6_AMBAM
MLDEALCLLEVVHVTSQEKLLEFVDKDNLLPEFGGTYTYDHQEWMSFRKFLEPFVSGCRLSGRQLVSVMQELRTSRVPPSSALALQLIDAQKRHIQDTFRDEQLRHLQEEGDTILQELQAYRARSPHNLDYRYANLYIRTPRREPSSIPTQARDALEKSGLLYNELKRAMAKLTKLADKRLQRLQECMLVRTFEEESSQRRICELWLHAVIVFLTASYAVLTWDNNGSTLLRYQPAVWTEEDSWEADATEPCAILRNSGAWPFFLATPVPIKATGALSPSDAH